MNIRSFTYKNSSVNWELEPITFNQLTLLVGASGVGKTRILESILNLKQIAKGSSLNGSEWTIEFSTQDKKSCKWSGKYENQGYIPEYDFLQWVDEKKDANKPKIQNEQLYIDGVLVVDRNSDNIKFNGVQTVKLSQNESVIFLLKEEDEIRNIFNEFEKIILDDNTNSTMNLFRTEDDDERITKLNSIELIQQSKEDIIFKLYCSYKNQIDTFEHIKNAFMEVFPYVEDIKVEPLNASEVKNKRLLFISGLPLIQIKENGVSNWIDQTKISSGMLRTLMQIAELYLCADSTVILIDEFENSLGINCIDDLTSNILTAERNLQFIITSHHPYIINKIDQSNWKLITRKAGKITAHDMSEFNLGKSKHEAFTQLMNLDLYEEGVEA